MRASGKSKAGAASPAAHGERKRTLWLLLAPLLVFAAAYAAGELLVKGRVDRMSGLKSAIQEREAALAELEAAIQTEEAALARLKSETWGLRFITFPDGAKGILLPEGMACECRGKMEGGEYGGSEGVALRNAPAGHAP